MFIGRSQAVSSSSDLQDVRDTARVSLPLLVLSSPVYGEDSDLQAGRGSEKSPLALIARAHAHMRVPEIIRASLK